MYKRPVKIQAHFSQVFTREGRFIRETPVVYTVQARLLGTTRINTRDGHKDLPYAECGHNHRSKKAAGPCLRRLTREYKALRSRMGKEARARMLAKNLGPMQQKSLLGPALPYDPMERAAAESFS